MTPTCSLQGYLITTWGSALSPSASRPTATVTLGLLGEESHRCSSHSRRKADRTADLYASQVGFESFRWCQKVSVFRKGVAFVFAWDRGAGKDEVRSNSSDHVLQLR